MDKKKNPALKKESTSKGKPGKMARGPAAKKKPTVKPKEMRAFPIVGIGASAGGLEALGTFFSHMPSDTGMAFVIIQHLSPRHKSIMASLLERDTAMKVQEIEDGMKVEPNHVYLNPPDKNVAIIKGTLQLMDPSKTNGINMPIDSFFRSLSEELAEKAICIILSGTATDGTLGCKAIKGGGGMVMVQDPDSATYDGMPRSAINTGLVDYILPVEKMPGQLIKYVRHPYVEGLEKVLVPEKDLKNHVQKIFALIRTATGHDFSGYKQTTIRRRIERRMAVHEIEKLEDYVRYLQNTRVEQEALFKDLLIGVTSFFRDAECFEILKKQVLPAMFKGKDPEEPIRIWVVGCSTGEEAYSLAIVLAETMDMLKKHVQVQIFASDIDAEAIGFARSGIYPDSIAADVSPERLKRFFTKDDNVYRIRKPIREMVVFAAQNIIKDPPFTKVDLLSCRNLLIYMDKVLQNRILSLCHYALNRDGILVLGTSESIGEFTDFYAPLDSKWKVFRKKGTTVERPLGILRLPTQRIADADQRGGKGNMPQIGDIHRLAERIILDQYAPPGVLVNEKLEVIYFMGETERYLSPPTGEATFDLLKMTRESLRYKLNTALRDAARQKKTVKAEGLRIKHNNESLVVDVTVRPIAQSNAPGSLMLVIFDEKRPSKRPKKEKKTSRPENEGDPTVASLELELASTKEYLQTTIEELETSNEELRSTNEELQSVNEELQSTNEELETSKEELQSTNEELVTVNSELQSKVNELSAARDDMNNLFASTEIGTIFLDMNLHIKRFTPSAATLFHLINLDIGRPLGDITSKLSYDHLMKDAGEVLDTLEHHQAEVQSEDGHDYVLRILPYRTVDNVIDGVVLTMVNITDQKKAERAAKEARRYAENIVDTAREALLVLDSDLKVVSANRAFYNMFRVKQQETKNKDLYELGNRHLDIPELRKLLEEILPKERTFEDFQIEHDFPGMGRRKMILNARQVSFPEGPPNNMIILAIEDVTDRNT